MTDKPTGLLAELLAPCLVFSHDRDLLDTGIAQREWVTLSSAAHDVAQLRAVYTSGSLGVLAVGGVGWGVGSGVATAAKRWPLPTLLVGAALAYLARRYWGTDRAKEQRKGLRTLASDAGRHIVAISEKAESARPLLESAAFVPKTEPPLAAQVARVVAVASTPPTAQEVGDRLGISRQKAAAALRAPHFVRADDRTYLLGVSHAPGLSVIVVPTT